MRQKSRAGIDRLGYERRSIGCAGGGFIGSREGVRSFV